MAPVATLWLITLPNHSTRRCNPPPTHSPYTYLQLFIFLTFWKMAEKPANPTSYLLYLSSVEGNDGGVSLVNVPDGSPQVLKNWLECL